VGERLPIYVVDYLFLWISPTDLWCGCPETLLADATV
jgi:hypothetical protein